MSIEQSNLSISMTDAVVEKVRHLIKRDGNENLKLRLYIVGGGCSGFQYGFGLDENVNEDDLMIIKDSVTLLVDILSAQYLIGSEVDYSESLQGAQFIVRNPNADTTCGCGSSFSLKEDLLEE